MGFTCGSKVLHSLAGLFRTDIGDMLRGKARQMKMDVPTIDVDSSNVAYKYPNKDAQSVANWCAKTAQMGICVIPITDGTRPICKQATFDRYAKKEKSRIKAHLDRKEIISLQLRLKEESLTESEKNNIRDRISILQTSMKRKETQSRNSIQKNFEDKLVEELEATVT